MGTNIQKEALLNVNSKSVKLVFILALLLPILCCIGALFSCIFYSSTYHEVERLNGIIYNDWGFHKFNIKATETEFNLLRWFGLALFIAPATFLLYSCFAKNSIYQQLLILLREAKTGVKELQITFAQLPEVEKKLVLGLFSALTMVRVYFLFTYPMHTDEVASYDYFVTEGLVAVAGYYPIPNNHILLNLLNWLPYQLSSDFYLVMRIPSLLIGTFGTVLLYLVVLRFSNFVVATLAAVLFFFAGMGLFYSFAGRGYFLQSLMSVFAFFAVAGILRYSRWQHLCWAVWVLSGIIGFYTIPTYLYSFLTTGVIGFFILMLKKRYTELQLLVVSGFVVLAGSAVLYLPVLLISGPGSLVSNSYVAPMAFTEVLQGFGAHFFRLERSISGLKTIGFFLVMAALLASLAVLVFGKNKDRLFGFFAPLLSLSLLLPYLFTVVQRVFPPDRVFFYKTFFSFALLALLLHLFLCSKNISLRLQRSVVAAIAVVWAVYQIIVFTKDSQEGRIAEDRISSAYQKIMRLQPATILVTDYHYQLFFYHYLKKGNEATAIFSEEQPGKKYEVVVLPAIPDGRPIPKLSSKEYTEAFSDGVIRAYVRK